MTQRARAVIVLAFAVLLSARDGGAEQSAEATSQQVTPPAPTLNGSGGGSASDKTTEFRRHWSSVRSDGTSIYDATTIVRMSDSTSASIVLVRDWRGDTWRIENALHFDRQAAVLEVRHLPTGEFLRRSYRLPMKARTRVEAILEAKAKQAAGEAVDEIFTIETRTAGRTAAQSEWNDIERSADWRSDLRLSLSTLFLDSTERMVEALFPHDYNLDSARHFLRTVSHAPGCEEPSSRYSKLVEQSPNCEFDKALGEACSEARLERVERARAKGTTLSRY